MAETDPDAARARELCPGVTFMPIVHEGTTTNCILGGGCPQCAKVADALRAARADERDNCLGAYSRHRKLGDKSTRCPKCDGWGWWVKDTHDGQGAMIECMVCDGTGHVVEELPAATPARGQQEAGGV